LFQVLLLLLLLLMMMMLQPKSSVLLELTAEIQGWFGGHTLLLLLLTL
jgi:hypothetical protein